MEKEHEIVCEVCGRKFKDRAGLAGHMQFKHKEEPAKPSAEPLAGALARRQSPLELLVKELQLPEIADGQAAMFDAGVQYGVKSVLIGVRVAQELSAMGVQQAVPIIKMAQEMRQAEGQAAQVIAGELAQVQMQSNKEIVAALQNLNVSSQAASPNPMQRMLSMLQTFPQMMMAAQNLMGLFGMKLGPGQPQGQPGGPQGPGQPQPQFQLAGQPKQMTEEDKRRFFGDDQ